MELVRGYSNRTHVLDRLSILLNAPDREDVELPRKPRQRQTRLDDIDQTKLIAAYQDGRSVYELAELFIVTRQTASAILERHGIKRRYKVMSPDDVQNAKKLYEAGAARCHTPNALTDKGE